MTYQTHDPYLRRHDARLERQDAMDARLPTTRSGSGTAIGLAVVLALVVGLGVMLSLGPDATTTAVDEPDGPAVALTGTNAAPATVPDVTIQDPSEGPAPAAAPNAD
jgi:hypothetical protein